MREGQILAMQRANGRRAALLFGQFEFMQTRLEAFERVLKVSRWHDRLRWTLCPRGFFALVDAVQAKLLNEATAKMAEVAARPRIEVPA